MSRNCVKCVLQQLMSKAERLSLLYKPDVSLTHIKQEILLVCFTLLDEMFIRALQSSCIEHKLGFPDNFSKTECSLL